MTNNNTNHPLEPFATSGNGPPDVAHPTATSGRRPVHTDPEAGPDASFWARYEAATGVESKLGLLAALGQAAQVRIDFESPTANRDRQRRVVDAANSLFTEDWDRVGDLVLAWASDLFDWSLDIDSFDVAADNVYGVVQLREQRGSPSDLIWRAAWVSECVCEHHGITVPVIEVDWDASANTVRYVQVTEVLP